MRDADPASNTLSWRWIAGLQTAGKTYLAKSDNIAYFTINSVTIEPSVLAQAPTVPSEPTRIKSNTAKRSNQENKHQIRITTGSTVVCCGDDLAFLIDHLDILPRDISIGILSCNDSSLSPKTNNFRHQAALEISEYVGSKGRTCSVYNDLDQIRTLASSLTGPVYIIEPPVGYYRRLTNTLQEYFTKATISSFAIERPWQSIVTPYSEKGFFQFWKHVRTQLLENTFFTSLEDAASRLV